METITGGCLCGDVRIEAVGLPYRVGICHCMDCRKHHGALFHSGAIYPEDALSLGAFDAPDRFVLTYELWTIRRESWLPSFPLDRRHDRDRESDDRSEGTT